MRFDDAAIQGILQARRAIGRVPFPNAPDTILGVRLLSERDIDLARFEAQMYLEAQAKKVQLKLLEFVRIDPESLDREHQRQVLLRAFVDPDSPVEKPTPFFADIAQVRSMDSVLTQRLWEAYVEWQEIVNPRLTLTAEEQDDLIDALKDEALAANLMVGFERSTLSSLVRSLAARLRTSLNGNSTTSLH